jgi:hypothetical protein
MSEQSPDESAANKVVRPPSNGQPPGTDLSQEIERVVDREPLDLVKCVRVFGNYYRCNWWSRTIAARTRADYAWSGRMADYVRKSCFLNVTMDAGALIMKEIGPVDTHRKNLVREV